MGIRRFVDAVLMGILAVTVLGNMAVAEEWEFSDTEKITVNGVSGDVVIRPSDNSTGMVQLQAEVHPPEAFEPRVEQNRMSLSIAEKWGRGSSRGHVEWNIYVPQQGGGSMSIQVNTSSGNLDWEGVDAQVDFKSSSGNINLARVNLEHDSAFSTSSGDYIMNDVTILGGARFKTSSGDLKLSNVRIAEGVKLSSSSGNIVCTECTGQMELTSSSGDVLVRSSLIEGSSSFSSSSGNVTLHLDSLPDEDLSASSSSGNVTLDVQDYGDNYTLILTCREDKGRIVSPFAPTSKRTFSKHGQSYEEIRIEHGSGGPEIALSTASGTVRVKN